MLKPGMIISDRYEIIDKVGSGGMADVYKAKCHRLNRFVAIKILKTEYSNDTSFVNKFRGEAQSAAGLSHPNIVNVYDVGDDKGLHYIVMELVEGITLKRFIERKGKLELKEAVGIVIQIAQGMEAAHDNHIIHRDIKPQNIIISRDGKVKVTDFGIAKATNSNTITSNAMGSVHYLSPEQARGGYSDEKSDIYSLGVTLYEMLSGKVPFAGDNTVSVALLHIQGEAMSLRELDPDIPISLDKIVYKCMQKKPERRYHSASELIIDLKKAIANPDGDFVVIPDIVTPDSPTINISDDLGKIKSGTLIDDELELTDTLKDHTNKIIDEDEEDLDTVDTKVEKIFIIGSIAAVGILTIVIIFLVVWFLLPPKNPGGDNSNDNPGIVTVTPTPEVTPEPTPEPNIPPTFVVPSVVNLPEQDAKASILAKSPIAEVRTVEDFSDDIEAGRVISQDPIAHSEVVSNSIITLTISIGPEPFEIPNVYNLTEEQARVKLMDELGLKLSFEYQENNDIESGRVISSNPERGSIVVKGDTVVLFVSTGPRNVQIVVPPIIDMTEREARNLLTGLGLELGNVTQQPSNTYRKGRITYQSTSAGQRVNAGHRINVIVSTGPETVQPTPVPTIRYVGEVVIDINPFTYMDETEAEIVLEMKQEGFPTVQIFSDVLDSNGFPLRVTGIEGGSISLGVVRMYVDGVLFKMNDQEVTWIVEFEAVEE